MNAETSKRRHLGRGLSALFGEQEEADATSTPTAAPIAEDSSAAPARGIATFPVDLLHPSPLQPRRHFDEGALTELAASIAVSRSASAASACAGPTTGRATPAAWRRRRANR